MASKAVATAALLLCLNLVFFTLVSATKCPSPPKRSPSPSKSPSPSPSKASCPNDTLKLGVCADLLNGLVNLVLGTPTNTTCCSLLNGLADLEAAVCLCTAIKANVLGISLNVPLSLSLVLNNCGKTTPEGFQCK